MTLDLKRTLALAGISQKQFAEDFFTYQCSVSRWCNGAMTKRTEMSIRKYFEDKGLKVIEL